MVTAPERTGRRRRGTTTKSESPLRNRKCPLCLASSTLRRPNHCVSVAFYCFCFLLVTGQVASKKVRLTWINGIATHVHHMDEGQECISKIFKEPVLYCYNPTAQAHDEDMIGWFGDLTQAGTQKLGLITDEVNSLVQHLRDALQAVGKRGIVVHIAHSQGALVTSLACKLLTPSEMRQMEVITFGGAAAIRKTPQTPFQRCINYYSVNDPLLWVAPSAAQSLRSGRVVGDADEEFCFLAPRVGDPIADHDLTGPTYRGALEWEATRFHREHRSLAYKVWHPVLFALLTLIRLIHERLQALLKAMIRSMLHSSVATVVWVQSKLEQIRLFVWTWMIRPAIFLFMVFVDAVQTWREPDKYELVSVVDAEEADSSSAKDKHT